MDQQVKSFWQRPEGTAGKITLALVVAAMVYAAYVGLPYLIILLSNTLYAAGLLGVLILLACMVSSDEIRTRVRLCFMNIMRFCFAVDPVDVIEDYIRKWTKNVSNMDEQIKNVNRQKGSLKAVIDRNEAERINSLKLARQCDPRDSTFRLETANAGRLEQSNKKLRESYNNLELASRTLGCMKEKAIVLIKDYTSTVNIEKRQRAALKAGNSAFRSAMLVINGDPQQKYMADHALEQLADQIGEQLGEMDHFMDMSVEIMKGADLQNAVDSEEGIRMLEEWSKSPSLLLGSEKNVLLSEANAPTSAVPLSIVPKNNYSSLIEKH